MKKSKKPQVAKSGTCFVIMPFGEYFDTYYQEIYFAAIEASGLVARRADDIFRPSPIINDIWQMTRESRLVLADLSKKNPNVFYELGLAHALSKPAILVTESINDVPFDLQSLRVIKYNKEVPNWGAILSKAITRSIKEVIASPQSAVLPAFLNIKDSASKPTVSSQEADFLQMKLDIAALRREVASSNPLYDFLPQQGKIEATTASQNIEDVRQRLFELEHILPKTYARSQNAGTGFTDLIKRKPIPPAKKVADEKRAGS